MQSDLYPLYGKLLSSTELKNLSNVDQCLACGFEGYLLCCDACTWSYHHRCINILLGRKLGDGKWLWHECIIVHSSKVGPLHGGLKKVP